MNGFEHCLLGGTLIVAVAVTAPMALGQVVPATGDKAAGGASGAPANLSGGAGGMAGGVPAATGGGAGGLPAAGGGAGTAGNAPAGGAGAPATAETETEAETVTPRTNWLDGRCSLAFCFGSEHQVGIEPLVELPFGKSFSASNGAVADYVNNHDLHVDLAAGVRVWMFKDWISLAVYLSKPLSDRGVRIPGSAFEYPATALRRPYPGIALGAIFDTLWIGFDHDELRNPDGTSGVAHDLTYPPNALVGSSWTVTVAIQPLTSFRNGIGVAKQAMKQQGAKP